MLKTISILLALTAAAFAQDSARDEAQVWNLEKAYWEYVKANDLEKGQVLPGSVSSADEGDQLPWQD